MDHERYDIIKLLGKGRTGGIYEARDLTLQRDVAIRRFFSECGNTDHAKWETPFLQIARNLCNLQHPNLVTVFDAGVDDDGAYMISQLTHGTRLSEFLQETSLHEWEAHELATQILDAFSVAHASGFFHGALTAGSILMVNRARGGHRFLIMDLGLAVLAPLIQGAHSHLGMMADPILCAPEMFSGVTPTAQSDLYMLGQLCYLSLAQGHPFAGHTLEEIASFHQSGALPPLTDYRQDLSPEFVTWLQHLTATNPDDRPRSAAEALKSLPKIIAPAPDLSALQQSNTVQLQLTTPPPAAQPSFPAHSLSAITANSLAPAPLLPIHSKKKSKTPLIVGISLAMIAIIVGSFIAISKNKKSAPEQQPETTQTQAAAPKAAAEPQFSALDSHFEFLYDSIYSIPLTQIPKKQHLIMDDPDTLDWVVYGGVPIADTLKQHAKRELILKTDIIGNFTPIETPNPRVRFLIDAQSNQTQIPGLSAHSKKSNFKNKIKNGYKITLKTPVNASINPSIILFLSGSNTNVKIQFKDSAGKRIGKPRIIDTMHPSFSLAEDIYLENSPPGCIILMEITTTGAKQKSLPFALSLSAIKITE